VLAFAPRISPRLLRILNRIDDPRLTFAELNRRLGAEAERLGLPRPSYQRVRELLHRLRALRRRPSTTSVLVDIAFRARPPEAFLDHISGVGVPRLPP
jgi:hypothetical protein